MYKCTECGMEFENKPDYCDCGNDEFVLTVIEPEKQEENPVKTEETPPVAEKSIPAEEFFKSQTEQKVNYNNPSSDERNKLPVSPIAIYVFAVCVIYAFYILIFWNPVQQTTEKITKEIEKIENVAIPSIDKLWKDPDPAKIVQQNNKVDNKQKTDAVQSDKTISALKPVQKPVTKPKTVNTNQPKTTAKTKTNNNNQTQQVKPVQQPQIQQDDAAKKAAEAAKKAQEAKQKAEAEALKAAEQARKNAMAKQELHSYKINLRNTIAQKIDFTKVIGDGDCAVTFKLDSSGRLVSRTFAKQSSNITLNNAVYNAVMAVPSYVAPPSGYSNETLRLNVKFTNGNFAITLE